MLTLSWSAENDPICPPGRLSDLSAASRLLRLVALCSMRIGMSTRVKHAGRRLLGVVASGSDVTHPLNEAFFNPLSDTLAPFDRQVVMNQTSSTVFVSDLEEFPPVLPRHLPSEFRKLAWMLPQTCVPAHVEPRLYSQLLSHMGQWAVRGGGVLFVPRSSYTYDAAPAVPLFDASFQLASFDQVVQKSVDRRKPCKD